MRSDARQDGSPEAGVVGAARVGGDSVAALLPRLRPGDVALLEVTDLDRGSAESLVEAGVVAVVNAGRLVGGPYANLGPRILAEAGVPWVDGVGDGALARIRDDVRVRVQDGEVHPAGTGGGDRPGAPLATGLALGASGPAPRRTRPRDRPALGSRVAGRPALLVGTAGPTDLRPVRRFVRERGPLVVALGSAAQDLVGLSWVPDVIVVSGDDPAQLPASDVLALAGDVVVVGRRDVDLPPGVLVHRVASTDSLEDAALALLDREDAAIVVGINLAPGTRPPAARSGSRSASGSWLLDARALPLLAPGRAGPTRVALLVTGVVALGVGLAVGLGPLARTEGRDPATSTGDSAATAAALRRAEAADRYAQRFVGTTAPRVYAGGLTGHGIVVISLPGASGVSVRALVAQIVAAGGSATRTVAVRNRVLDPAQRTRIDSVGSQLVAQLTDPRLDPGATTYPRLGQLLALALTTTQPSSALADPVATTIRQSLGSAGLVDFPTDVRLAPLVLLVLPSGSAAGSVTGSVTTTQQADVLAGVLGGLALTATGVVVAGDTESGDDGLLAALRLRSVAGPVSTVDGIDQPLGRATAVLALEAVLAGTAGAYGASGADGPVPVP